MRGLVKAVAGAVMVGAALVGCSSGPPVVGKADLEKDIAGRLEAAGQKPQTVTCDADLEGVVGKTTTCEVVLTDVNAIEPVVEVTKVEDTTVSYEMTPALSQAQLEKSVAGLVAENAGQEVTGVT